MKNTGQFNFEAGTEYCNRVLVMPLKDTEKKGKTHNSGTKVMLKCFCLHLYKKSLKYKGNFVKLFLKGNQKLKITPLQFKRKCLHLMYHDDK